MEYNYFIHSPFPSPPLVFPCCHPGRLFCSYFLFGPLPIFFAEVTLQEIH